MSIRSFAFYLNPACSREDPANGFQTKAVRFILITLLIAVSACSAGRQTTVLKAELDDFEQYLINHDIDPDDAMLDLIEPYVLSMRSIMDRVLTVSEGPFTRAVPEGSLGNLAADMLRVRANYEMRRRVHIAVTNNGGLRIPLPEGKITVGHIYELMPFENHMVVLKLTGEQVLRLADEIAAAGGEPVSGLRMRIHNGKAGDVLVGSAQVNPIGTYWVATNNWLADGGGEMPVLWEPVQRTDLDLLIRDVFIDYLDNHRSIRPGIDYRIR